MGAVGDVGGDFEAAVDRTRCEDQHVFLRQFQSVPVHCIKVRVFPGGRERADNLAFKLDAEQVENVHSRQDRVQRMADFDAQRSSSEIFA